MKYYLPILFSTANIQQSETILLHNLRF